MYLNEKCEGHTVEKWEWVAIRMEGKVLCTREIDRKLYFIVRRNVYNINLSLLSSTVSYWVHTVLFQKVTYNNRANQNTSLQWCNKSSLANGSIIFVRWSCHVSSKYFVTWFIRSINEVIYNGTDTKIITRNDTKAFFSYHFVP